MNNILDIKRLVRLIIYENKSSRFLLNITTGILVYTVICMLVRIINGSTHNNAIIGEGFGELLLSISPILCYYSLILKKGRLTLQSTLPASNLEKYLSIVVNTLVIAPATIITMTTIINRIGSYIYVASNYTESMLPADGNYLQYILTCWTWISYTTFLLLVYTQFSNLKTVAITLAIPVANVALATILIGMVDGDYVRPTAIMFYMFIISNTNFIVFQLLIYLLIKRIKA